MPDTLQGTDFRHGIYTRSKIRWFENGVAKSDEKTAMVPNDGQQGTAFTNFAAAQADVPVQHPDPQHSTIDGIAYGEITMSGGSLPKVKASGHWNPKVDVLSGFVGSAWSEAEIAARSRIDNKAVWVGGGVRRIKYQFKFVVTRTAAHGTTHSTPTQPYRPETGLKLICSVGPYNALTMEYSHTLGPGNNKSGWHVWGTYMDNLNTVHWVSNEILIPENATSDWSKTQTFHCYQIRHHNETGYMDAVIGRSNVFEQASPTTRTMYGDTQSPPRDSSTNMSAEIKTLSISQWP